MGGIEQDLRADFVGDRAYRRDRVRLEVEAAADRDQARTYARRQRGERVDVNRVTTAGDRRVHDVEAVQPRRAAGGA